MAALKELRRLRDEERTLVNTASKISDQLNRLKVEELALVNMIRLNESSSRTPVKEETLNEDSDDEDDVKDVKQETNMEEQDVPDTELCPLDLNVDVPGTMDFEEEEEEEDEDDILSSEMRQLQQ